MWTLQINLKQMLKMYPKIHVIVTSEKNFSADECQISKYLTIYIIKKKKAQNFSQYNC